VTGILDSLERAGWVARERSASDCRAVVVRALRTKSPEVTRVYLGMNHALDQPCSGYTEAQLEMVADFLRRIIKAGLAATEELTSG
jgi:DNA-binding MarR family transcriptional regulator